MSLPAASNNALQSFRYDPNKTPEQQLETFLQPHGLSNPLPLNADGLVDLGRLVAMLPENLGSDLNAAHKELYEYLYAIPPRRRALGVYVAAEHLLSLLLERLEFFEGLSRGVVRTCKGVDCPHFSVCPFQEIVKDLTEDDGVPCAVEREVVRQHVEAFVQPGDGKRPKVDPRRPEMALLFKQLVQLLVRQVRISMYMQTNDVMIDHYEILKDGDMEKFDSMNQVEHPLMAAWDRVTSQIQRLMKDMGLTPEFQIKQGLWIDDDQQLDAERRSVELAHNWIRDAYQKTMQRLPEGSPERALIAEALEAAEKQAARARDVSS